MHFAENAKTQQPWMQFGSTVYQIGSDTIKGATPDMIADSLSQINRFVGHSRFPYSVAQHSLHVSDLLKLDAKLEMMGLVHDVAETIVGDRSWPVKRWLSAEYPYTLEALDGLERAAEAALFGVLGIPSTWSLDTEAVALVKRADWVAVATEKRDVMWSCPRDWDMLPHAPARVRITRCEAHDAACYWLAQYRQLAEYLNLKPY